MKNLKRTTYDRIIGGVCGGLGEYFNIEPTVVRLIWALVTLFSMGVGVVIYLLFWLIVPEE